MYTHSTLTHSAVCRIEEDRTGIIMEGRGTMNLQWGSKSDSLYMCTIHWGCTKYVEIITGTEDIDNGQGMEERRREPEKEHQWEKIIKKVQDRRE